MRDVAAQQQNLEFPIKNARDFSKARNQSHEKNVEKSQRFCIKLRSIILKSLKVIFEFGAKVKMFAVAANNLLLLLHTSTGSVKTQPQ